MGNLLEKNSQNMQNAHIPRSPICFSHTSFVCCTMVWEYCCCFRCPEWNQQKVNDGCAHKIVSQKFWNIDGTLQLIKLKLEIFTVQSVGLESEAFMYCNVRHYVQNALTKKNHSLSPGLILICIAHIVFAYYLFSILFPVP